MKFKIDWIKTSQVTAIIFGILGILIVVTYVILLWLQGYYSGDKIILEKFASFGDFIGGLVGSLWAFAGVLLFYVALVYQRKELEETIKSRDDLTVAYKNQIKASELQIFQTSFFELFKMFVNKRDTISNIGWFARPIDNITTMAFDSAYNLALNYAHNHNLVENGKGISWDEYIVIMDFRYIDHLAELCEYFTLIYHHINLLENERDRETYERIVLNILTIKHLAAIIIFAVLNSDNTSRLKNTILESETFNHRCIELLTMDSDLITFWLHYRSKNRKN